MTRIPKLASGALLTAVGVLVVAANVYAQPPRPATPVEIVAPVPIPVVDAADPATHAFQVTFCDAASFFGGSFSCPAGSIGSLEVPADRSVVIEYVSSGFCFVSNLGNYEVGIVTTVNGVSTEHRVPLVRGTVDSRHLRASEMVRIYADAGSRISKSSTAGSSGNEPGGAECRFNLSGYYVLR